jgi:hypothetical protein
MTVRLGISRREASRPRPPRTHTPIVDQHATWVAVNPIQDRPKACAYCVLNERGQTAVRPECLASPAGTADLLGTSPYYAPDRPVALYTWTDAMALPASRAHMADLLGVLAGRQAPNPVVLIITKCLIPGDAIDAVTTVRRAGLRVIVYVSYSGLGCDIERGIRHEDLKTNFPRLAEAGVPVVHYWRPAFPESATTHADAPLDPVPRPARSAGEVDACLRLLAVAGQLAETAMVSEGFGHQSGGTRSSVQEAGAVAVAACDVLAGHLGLDLIAEFRTMVTDGEAFLASRDSPR